MQQLSQPTACEARGHGKKGSTEDLHGLFQLQDLLEASPHQLPLLLNPISHYPYFHNTYSHRPDWIYVLAALDLCMKADCSN